MTKNDLLDMLDERIMKQGWLEHHSKDKTLVNKYRAIRFELEDIRDEIDKNWDE